MPNTRLFALAATAAALIPIDADGQRLGDPPLRVIVACTGCATTAATLAGGFACRAGRRQGEVAWIEPKLRETQDPP